MIKKYKSESALILTTLIWGGTFPAVKAALDYSSPMTFISLRFTLALLILLPFVKKIFSGKSIPNKKLIFGGIIIGFLYFLEFAFQTTGLKYTSASKSGFITGTFVIFVPFFQLLIEKRKPSKENLIGILLVLLGLIFLSSSGNSILNVFSEIGGNFNFGDFLTLLCAVFYALYVVYLDIISKKFDYMPLVFMQIAVTAVGSIFLSIFFSFLKIDSFKIDLNSPLIFAVLYTGIFATVLTTILQTKYQKFITPTKAGIIFSFEPVFAAVFAFFALSEKISNFSIIGCVFIFSGLLVTEIFKKKNLKNESRR